MVVTYQPEYKADLKYTNGEIRWYRAGNEVSKEEALAKVRLNPDKYLGTDPKFRIMKVTREIVSIEQQINFVENK